MSKKELISSAYRLIPSTNVEWIAEAEVLSVQSMYAGRTVADIQ
jgi:hypothetical protein